MYIYIHYINIDNNYIIIYIHIYNQYDSYCTCRYNNILLSQIDTIMYTEIHLYFLDLQ